LTLEQWVRERAARKRAAVWKFHAFAGDPPAALISATLLL
jgi:hypothetical protein